MSSPSRVLGYIFTPDLETHLIVYYIFDVQSRSYQIFNYYLLLLYKYMEDKLLVEFLGT